MQIIKHILIATALACMAWGCGSKSTQSEGHVLAVSIEPQRAILERIAGPDFEVTTVLGRGADPETFDPSTAQRLALDKADVYFATGTLPFEEKLAQSLSESTAYISTADSALFIYGTHEHHHAEEHHHADGAADPHYWTSFAGLQAIARTMAQTLANTYPDRADTFTQRYQATIEYLDSLHTQVSTTLHGTEGAAFAVWHPSLSYFAREFGLEQLSLGAEGKDLSAKGLTEAIDHARADSVKVFFYQPGIDSRQAEVMSRSIGSRLISIYPLAYEWEDQIITIANELARP